MKNDLLVMIIKLSVKITFLEGISKLRLMIAVSHSI
jgi:hypothetical protein